MFLILFFAQSPVTWVTSFFHRVFRFYRLLRRLATLLSQQASLMASNEAFKKQAEGASNAAKKYMDENELLQEVNLRTFTHTHTEQVMI